MRFAIVCTDVLFRSKVRDAIRAEGHEPVAIASLQAMPEDLAGAIIDLNDARLDPIEAITALTQLVPRERLLGFGSHVRPDLLEDGRNAGCGLVVPRSKAVRAIGEMLRGETFGGSDIGD